MHPIKKNLIRFLLYCITREIGVAKNAQAKIWKFSIDLWNIMNNSSRFDSVSVWCVCLSRHRWWWLILFPNGSNDPMWSYQLKNSWVPVAFLNWKPRIIKYFQKIKGYCLNWKSSTVLENRTAMQKMLNKAGWNVSGT